MAPMSGKPASIQAWMLFFLLPSMQIGIAAQRFQQNLHRQAGHDAWMSVLLAAAATHFCGWVFLLLMKRSGRMDLYALHIELFGKSVAFFLNFVWLVYFWVSCLAVALNFMISIQAWLFPDLNNGLYMALIAFIIWYGVRGGLPVLIGYCVVSFLLGLWLLVFYYDVVKYADYRHLLPIGESSVRDVLSGAKAMITAMLGFEMLLFVMPFVRDPSRAGRYIQAGLAFSSINYTLLMISAIVYFSGRQLDLTIWPTFYLYKLIELPIIQRLDYILVPFWLLLVVDNCMLYMWASTRGMTVITGIKQKHALLFSCLLMFACSFFFHRRNVESLQLLFDQVGFWLVYTYPLLLLPIVLWKYRRRQSSNPAAPTEG